MITVAVETSRLATNSWRKISIALIDRIVRVARTFLLPASDHADDIPILKQAKADYAKLQ